MKGKVFFSCGTDPDTWIFGPIVRVRKLIENTYPSKGFLKKSPKSHKKSQIYGSATLDDFGAVFCTGKFSDIRAIFF